MALTTFKDNKMNKTSWNKEEVIQLMEATFWHAVDHLKYTEGDIWDEEVNKEVQACFDYESEK